MKPQNSHTGVDRWLDREADDGRQPYDLPEDAIERLQAPILRSLKPVRPLAPTPLFLLVFLVVFGLAVALGVYELGVFGWMTLTLLQKAVIILSLAASAALLGFSVVRQMQPGSKSFFSPALLPISIFILLLLAMAAIFQYENDPHFVRLGMGCLQAGIPFAALAALVFWLVLRRGVVLHPYIAGATAGMLAGLVGTSVLEVHCPILDLRHILVWHFGIALLGSLAGLLAALLGTLLRRWSDVTSTRPR